jgi:hypothetical protein
MMTRYKCEYCGREMRGTFDLPRCMHWRGLSRKNGMLRVKHQTYPVVIVSGEMADEIESIFTEEQSSDR